MPRLLAVFTVLFLFLSTVPAFANDMECEQQGVSLKWNYVLDDPPGSFNGLGFARSTAVDSEGNSYVTGFFEGLLDFDPTDGEDLITATGGYDIFVTRFNADGSYAWTKTIGGFADDVAYDLAFDSTNNSLVVVGTFYDIVDFDPSEGEDLRQSQGGSSDNFVTKLGLDGSYISTQTFGGFGTDRVFSVALSPKGDIFLTGQFIGGTDFDPTDDVDFQVSAGTGFDIFVTRLNGNGSYGWTKTFKASTQMYGSNAGWGIAVDANEHVYITGQFIWSADFDPTTNNDIRTSNGGYDIFITQLNTDGAYGWTKTMGSTGVSGIAFDSGYGITTDSDGNIFVTGSFIGAVDFDPGAGVDLHTSHGDGVYESDVFLLRLNADSSYGWVRTFGGEKIDYALDVAVDHSGHVLATGTFQKDANGGIDFDPSDEVDFHPIVTGSKMFVTQFDLEGNYDWAWTETPSIGNTQRGTGIVTTANGDIFVSGYFPAFLTKLSTACNLLGDLNEDGQVDAADLGILLGNWGNMNSPADLDGDGVVGASDLGVLLSKWS